ncbi:Acg family FMN-binding oxidoreductase [Nocardia sp. NPDC059239]|uniref:Acg family FMN-binding oxidoreductase n=1 Tax=unclassified Nocardia TaxID=2637762 RepID=UPI003694F5DD
MSRTHPDTDTIRAALALAVRAPSVHNTQPWQWRIGESTLHLYADDTRWLKHTDPDRRELVLSCGAALHHLRVAIGAVGWETIVHRLPNHADPRHLAAIEFRSGATDPTTVQLAQAIARRRSDRRHFTSWEVPAVHADKVIAAARVVGVEIRDVDALGVRGTLAQAFEQASASHAQDPDYIAELHAWSGHHAAPSGVPARNAVVPTDPAVRPFSDPRLPEAVVRDTDEFSRMLLLSTGSDDPLAWLRAGESTSAALLTATVRGLATCALTEPLELPAIREQIRTNILGGFGHPQVIIRMGWAATSAGPVPPSPRFALDEVVHPLEPADSADQSQ